MLWISIRRVFEINNKKYDERCAQNKENIKKRWSKSDTNVYDRISEDTNVYDRIFSDTKDTDIDIETDIVKDIDKDTDIVIETEIETEADRGTAATAASSLANNAISRFDEHIS